MPTRPRLEDVTERILWDRAATVTGLHLGRLVEVDREHGRLVTSDQHAFRASPAAIP